MLSSVRSEWADGTWQNVSSKISSVSMECYSDEMDYLKQIYMLCLRPIFIGLYPFKLSC